MPRITQKATLENSSTPISTGVVSDTPGRLRLRVAPGHRHPGDMQHIAKALEANPNVNRIRTNVQHGSIVIDYARKDGSRENVAATLQDLGIIFRDITEGNTEAAGGLTNAVVDLNQRVKQATNGAIDLRFLFPLGLGTLAVRQLLIKGLQVETIPWYVLAWYAFDSFIKLHGTGAPKSSGE